ncbi:hypothetical protein IJ096_02265 [Candidatus Saccharibacteria bacterium]|nr:hypothetical protein [Candidatus Saccharibacteria bacterium]
MKNTGTTALGHVGIIVLMLCLGGVIFNSVPVGAIKCEAGSVRGEGAEVQSAADCNVAEEKKDSGDVANAVGVIVGILVAIVGIIAVIVIIYGGVQILISQGDSGKVQTGKMAITYGVIGLVIAGLAEVVVQFILSSIGS